MTLYSPPRPSFTLRGRGRAAARHRVIERSGDRVIENHKIAKSQNRQSAYKTAFLDKSAMIATHDLLALVGYEVPYAALERWTGRMREKAEDYAARKHLHASGNLIRRVPCPAFLKKYKTTTEAQR